MKMQAISELSNHHHDYGAKLNSLRAALAEPFDRAAAGIAVEVVMRLRTAMWQQGMWRMFEPEVERAIEAAIRLRMSPSAAALLVYRAGLMEAMGEWKKVSPLVHRAIAFSDDQSVRAEGLLHLGTANHNLGNYSAAGKCFSQALRLTNDCTMQARILHKLHRTQKALGNRRTAERTVDRILELVSSTDQPFRAELLLDKASLVRGRSPMRAFKLAMQAQAIYRALQLERGQAYAHLEAARCFLAKRQLKSALRRLSLAKTAYEALAYEPGLAHVRLEQGKLFLCKNEVRRAQELFAESCTIAARKGYFAALVRAHAYHALASWRAHSVDAALKSVGSFTLHFSLHLFTVTYTCISNIFQSKSNAPGIEQTQSAMRRTPTTS